MRESRTVGPGPSLGEGLVVCLDGMPVHELAGVVGVVAGGLQPDGKVFVVVALGDEFVVTACRRQY